MTELANALPFFKVRDFLGVREEREGIGRSTNTFTSRQISVYNCLLTQLEPAYSAAARAIA